MALGELLKQARLDAGLSQRQLCGEEITRNMLSQIENGAARPSMDTLRYLAFRLGKPVSYFLEEQSVSPNQALVCRAREAYAAADYAKVLDILQTFTKDGIFDEEATLLQALATVGRAEQALAEGRKPYAVTLLRDMKSESLYMQPELERKRILLLAKAQPEKAAELAESLPTDDDALLLKAQGALAQGQIQKALCLLGSAEVYTEQWYLLKGEALIAAGEFAEAAECFLQVEDRAFSHLEHCYEQLGDYKMAYYYAKKQR